MWVEMVLCLWSDPSDFGLYSGSFEVLWCDSRPCIYPVEPVGIFALMGGQPGWFRLPSSVSVVVPFVISKPFQCCLALYFVIYWDSPFRSCGQKTRAFVNPLCLALPTTARVWGQEFRERKKWWGFTATPLGPQLLQLEQKVLLSQRSRRL